MIIKFIKDHPIGIKAESLKEVDSKFAQRMIDGGYAEIISGDEAKATVPVVKEPEPIIETPIVETNVVDLEALKALYESKKAFLNEDEQLQAEIDLESGDQEKLNNLLITLNLKNTDL